ncbi:MAG: heme exporter protein CcmD [Gammaproteobacteria bacterium]|uniref:Heme exporter protein D n=1 Tax=OM182 bacterium MED-G24 TaxID=1986255 RepID=A0A2A5WWD4_9GAMM|nr:heme exporter protein CcmD [Gammaproteobacteria bacterium]PDH40598.1 MAG: heme exporter protein CcmD [OM182 bacterium MED-G24]RPG26045.1 MAG: heme exporter protein CcmD [Gammaproteobacteria bacterium TMED50]
MNWFEYGTHAPYVWAVYSIALVVFVANIIFPMRRHGRLLKMLAKDTLDRQRS